MTFKNYSAIYSVAWTADGDDIVFSQREGEGRRVVLRVGLSGGEPQPIAGVGLNAGGRDPRGPDGARAKDTRPQTICRLPGRQASSRRDCRPLIESAAATNENADYSPDGRKIAFESDRGGRSNIWMTDGDGSNPIQFTTFESDAGTPRWSPDGRRLVFDSLGAGDYDLYVDGRRGRQCPAG